MINFRVFRLGDVVKNLVKIVILIVCIILFARFFNGIKKMNFQSFIENRKQEIKGKTLIECLQDNLDKPYRKDNQQNLISKELGFIKATVETGVSTIDDNANIPENVVPNVVYDDVQESPYTEVVQEHNKKDTFNATYSNVQIKNETSVALTPEMISPEGITISRKNVVIFHTHTSESYTPTEQYSYIPSGNFRTQDMRCSVVGVGDELTNRLLNKNIGVIHDTTVHDYPEYNNSYTRSMQTVQNVLANNPADLVIDLHRDALADSSYGPSVMIGNEKAAQLLFVMGSNEGGLEHPDWITNLRMAIKIQEKANEMYPGLFKPIMVSKYRYNQHLAKGSCIIEVGATGNTMEECLVSMKYLAEVLDRVLE